jgi:hypothetical protein
MLNNINEIVEELSAGRMVIVVDDESRENEGDLLMAASFAGGLRPGVDLRADGGKTSGGTEA